MAEETKNKINKNWIIVFNILFYLGLAVVIVGFVIWWLAVLGLIIMVFSRFEEERIKDYNLGVEVK
jgi:1,4-dihydroxy-2-naphthoate octaprenyltransferase